jgi:hypothetical protein
VTRDLTPLPDLVQGAGLTGPARTRRPVYVDLLPPCNAACPAGENIQAWLAAAQDGDYERAWRLLTEDNPFPAIHGRVCYHPCEDACNRADLDSPVSVHAVERFLGGWAIEHHLPFMITARTDEAATGCAARWRCRPAWRPRPTSPPTCWRARTW